MKTFYSRGNIAECVRNILDIICGNSDVTEAAQNLIATWIRRRNTLTLVSKVRLIPLMYS